MLRLSVAIWPPSEIVELLERLPRDPLPNVNWSTPEQWMVKVRPLGRVPEAVIEPLATALDRALAELEPVTCVLGPVTQRLGGQWLGTAVSGLDELAELVFGATAALVPVTHPQPFRADLILARGRVPARLAGTPVSGRWLADRVSLVADRSAPGRIRFEDLAEFPLTGS